jgi:hypothetical protein
MQLASKLTGEQIQAAQTRGKDYLLKYGYLGSRPKLARAAD